MIQIFTQEQILKSQKATDFLLDTIIDNLSYIYGKDMGSEENREEWIQYNLKTPHPYWRAVIGEKAGEMAGLLIYTIDKRCLTIHDIEITKENRLDPFLLLGLFRILFRTDGNRFDQISGYINKENRVSQKNFLNYATFVTETERGYALTVDQEKTSKIKGKFQNNT